MMRVDCYGGTDVGKSRHANEDAFRIDGARGFVMVADGVGGAAGGATASAIAVDVVHQHMADELDRLRAEGAADDQASRLRLTRRLQQALAIASATVFTRGHADPKLRGMATTSVVVQVVNNWVLIGHVGDSRVYLIRGAKPYQITEDHSMARAMLARGAITAEEAENFHNNVIVRAVGMQPTVEVDIISFELVPGDVLVLCSDGLSDPVEPEDMVRIIRDTPVATTVQSLIDRANHHGGPDNITVALVEASGAAPAVPAVPMENQVELLQHVSLFRDLSFQEAARMLGYVQEQRFDTKQVVFSEGEVGNWFYIVAEGSVAISQRGKLLTTIERGGHFGELALVSDAVRSATVHALRPTILLTVSREAIVWLVRHDHGLAVKLLWGLLGNLAERLKTLSSQLTS